MSGISDLDAPHRPFLWAAPWLHILSLGDFPATEHSTPTSPQRREKRLAFTCLGLAATPSPNRQTNYNSWVFV